MRIGVSKGEQWGGAMPCEIKSPRVHVAVHYFGVRLER